MIGPIVNCFESTKNSAVAQCLALTADCAIGLALLIIGICGTQWEFMPSYLAPALLGGGTVYTMVNILRIGIIIKTSCQKTTKTS